MVHVTQENVTTIDVDLLIHEYLRHDEGKKTFVYIVSPFISDHPIAQSWSAFASNLVNVSDVDTYVDLVLLLSKVGVPVQVISRSPRDLLKMKLSREFIQSQGKILRKFLNSKCDVRTNSSLHAKATVTSRGVLSGSFNLTRSGRSINLEAGFYFANTSGVGKEEYDNKLVWVKKIFEESKVATANDLTI